MQIRGVLLLLFLLALSSCASDNVVSNRFIQKRKYTNGYHIWGHGKKQKEAESTVTIIYVTNTPLKNPTKPLELNEEVTLEADTIIDLEPNLNQVQLKEVKTLLEIEKIICIPNDSILPLPPKNNPYAVMSVAAGAGSIVVLFVGAVLLSIVLAVAVILLANHGKTQIKQHPEKYTGKGLANLGITIGFIVLGIMVIAIVALFAFFL